MNMLLTKIFRVLVTEHLVEVLTGIRQFVGTRENKRIVGDIDDTLQPRHLLRVNLSGHHISYEKQLGIRMVDDVVNLIWCELMEDRHCYGTISQHG